MKLDTLQFMGNRFIFYCLNMRKITQVFYSSEVTLLKISRMRRIRFDNSTLRELEREFVNIAL